MTDFAEPPPIYYQLVYGVYLCGLAFCGWLWLCVSAISTSCH